MFFSQYFFTLQSLPNVGSFLKSFILLKLTLSENKVPDKQNRTMDGEEKVADDFMFFRRSLTWATLQNTPKKLGHEGRNYLSIKWIMY